MPLFAITILCLLFSVSTLKAQPTSCESTDKSCMFSILEELTTGIEEIRWKDQTYREIAKLLAKEKKSEEAMRLIALIENPDTKAMTIRGIGMSAAETELYSEQEFSALFLALREHAETIEHPPSYAIALTYIAMAQAFAGDDKGAMKTASDMKNAALRNKAYAESAEIQAERGDLEAAMASIAEIEDKAFRNKAHRLVSKIFANRKKYDEALKAALSIDNAYQQSQAILYILAKQISPEEVSLVE